MEAQTRTEEEIKKAEQYEALKQTVLRLLDDPEVQQKIVSCCAIGPKHTQKGEHPQAGSLP
jgi:hypothetical protein